MRKRKSGPALFDVLSRERDTTSDPLEVPPWWSSGGVLARPKPVRLLGHGNVAGSSGLTDEVPAGMGESIPFLDLVGGRMRVSFTSVSAAAGVFLVLVAILAGFELGRRSGDDAGFSRGYEAGRVSYAAEAMDEIQVARSQPPVTQLVQSLLPGPGMNLGQGNARMERRAAEGQSTVWIRDHTYIVAQEFAAERTEDVQHAQEYLEKHGIATALVRLPGGALQLITKQGYNQKDPIQKQLAEQLLGKEHGVGSKYFAAGGGYRLKGYFRTLKGDTW